MKNIKQGVLIKLKFHSLKKLEKHITRLIIKEVKNGKNEPCYGT